MKRSVVALGILGLVYALVLPGASAQMTLLQTDFSDDALLKAATTYIQGRGNAIRDDDTILPFYVRDGVLTSSPPDATTGSDGTGANNDLGDPPSISYLLLTGDKAWTDVAVQVKARSDGQNTGSFALILRAAPKTKPEDPDSYYVLQYRTHGGTDEQLDSEIRDGIPTCDSMVKNRDGEGDEGVCMRILKVVKGKWTMLAEQGAANSNVHIPRVYRLGVDHDVSTDPANDGNGTDALTGYYFRFVAKGNQLTGFVSKDGQTWEQVLQATDSELTAGQVGFMHYNYRPLTKEILVQDAP
jgi:hypothetical protein